MSKIAATMLGSLFLTLTTGVGAETNAHSLAEIISVLKTRYVDREALNEQRLNDAALAGILQALGRGATLLPAGAEQPPERTRTDGALARAEIIDPEIGYLRIADVTEQTPAAVDAELEKFSEAKATAYILDLRFADGTNYEAAAAVAGRFLNNGQPLFALRTAAGDERLFRTTPPANAPKARRLTEMPLLALVNGETTGSAEALAGALRAQGRAILVGNATAGAPVAWDTVSLSDGRSLRVASAKIVFPAQPAATEMKVSLFPKGLTPDVPVPVDPQLERNAVLRPPPNVTLTASLQAVENRKRITEAELVRAFRGEPLELKTGVSTNTAMPMLPQETMPAPAPASDAGAAESAPRKPEPAPSVDLVLQRAVDILKGIRVLLSSE